MFRQVIVEDTPLERRAYILEADELVECHRELPEEGQRVGSIYLGRVERVLPGVQAVFVDIGLDKNAFLPATEIGGDATLPLKKRLRTGEFLIVQVQREPGGEKGVRVSTHINLAGRMVVLTPRQSGISISKKLEDNDRRTFLKELISTHLPPEMGAVVRTSAAQAEDAVITGELSALLERWQEIEREAALRRTPGLIGREDGLFSRIAMDWMQPDTQVRAVGEPVFLALTELARRHCPELLPNIVCVCPQEGMSLLSELESKLDKLMQRRVWLKSGGTLVVDRAEALWVLDVNSAKYVGAKQQLGEALVRTNEEAAMEAARQLRLRDMEGMILIDFIHLPPDRQSELMMRMREAVSPDRGQTQVLGFSAMGLMEVRRRRAHRQAPAAEKISCPYCQGSARILSPGETARLALRKAVRQLQAQPGSCYSMSLYPSEAKQAEQWLESGMFEAMDGMIVIVPDGKHPNYYRVTPAAYTPDQEHRAFQLGKGQNVE